MYNDCNCESKTAMPMNDTPVAKLADTILCNLKEANAILNHIFDNTFGPRIEKQQEEPPRQMESFMQVIAINAEKSAEIVNRLAELNARLYG